MQRHATKVADTTTSAPTQLNSFRFGWFAFKLILDRPVRNLHFAIQLSIPRMLVTVLHSSEKQGHIYPTGAISQQILDLNRGKNIHFSQILLIVPHDSNFLLFLRIIRMLLHVVVGHLRRNCLPLRSIIQSSES
jgi:hypothetical protein